MYRISRNDIDGKRGYVVQHYIESDPNPTTGTERQFASHEDAFKNALGRAAKMSLMVPSMPEEAIVEDGGRQFQVTAKEL